MGYYEFKIKISDESKDALIQMMSQAGCLGVIENGNTITAYFPDFLGINKITDALSSSKKTLKDSGLDDKMSFEYVFIGERDWNESWKKKFKPIDVGENLTILPPWEDTDNGRTNLIRNRPHFRNDRRTGGRCYYSNGKRRTSCIREIL